MRATPDLLTPAELDQIADLLAVIATRRLGSTWEEAVMAGEILDRLARIRHLMTDPPDLRMGW